MVLSAAAKEIKGQLVDARTADAWKVVLVFHLSENLTDSENAFMQKPQNWIDIF